MPTMQAPAMGRLDAIIGRSSLDAAEQVLDAAPEQRVRWFEQEGGSSSPRLSRVHRAVGGQTKGPIQRGSSRRDECWYRIPDSNR
jgi:hypothetical protein